MWPPNSGGSKLSDYPMLDAFASRKSQGVFQWVLALGDGHGVRLEQWFLSFKQGNRRLREEGGSLKVRQPNALLGGRAGSTYAPSPRWAAPRSPKCQLPSAPGQTRSQQ